MTEKALRVAYFYPDQLNLYGDTGNIEILMERARRRGMSFDLIRIHPDTVVTAEMMNYFNFVYMGGGPDSEQKAIYHDLLTNKGPWLKDYVESGKTGLFICGAYQLLGNYYKAADGTVLEGIGALNLYTHSFGNTKPRCIGNTVAKITPSLLSDPLFKNVNHVGEFIVGFENHGGRTYLDESMSPLGLMTMGFGNNGADGTEGVLYKGSFGTYFHGPLLARNPHIADYLLARAVGVDLLPKLDDSLIISAHTASHKLKQ